MIFEWISVKEKLPPVEINVLVYDDFNMYITCRLDEDLVVWDESNQIFDDITHWAHLPNKPNLKK